MPAKPKKQRGVLARLRRRLKIKPKPQKPKPPAKPKTSYPASGYGDPAPRRKRLQEVFDFGLRRKE